MTGSWAWVAVVSVGVGVGAAQTAARPATAPAAATVKKTCVVDREPPNAAETALNRKDYGSAELQFRAMLEKNASDGVAHEGLVRALIEQDKVADAARDAEAWAAAAPGDTMALIALGDVRLRQGDPHAALVQAQNAGLADLCNARAYYALARVESFWRDSSPRRRR